MVTWLIESDLSSQADPMLQRIQDEAVEAFDEDDPKTISVLIRIAITLQDHDRWEDARPRFEQALAASISSNNSLTCPLTKSLEDALYNKQYENAVPTSKDIERQAVETKKRRRRLVWYCLSLQSIEQI